jgi:hypothetical protein
MPNGILPVTPYTTSTISDGYAECLRVLTSTIGVTRVVARSAAEARVFIAPHRSTDAPGHSWTAPSNQRHG